MARKVDGKMRLDLHASDCRPRNMLLGRLTEDALRGLAMPAEKFMTFVAFFEQPGLSGGHQLR